ncbi:FGGY-family carbohydrate kinase [Pengzhenrongella sicca]|uniref:Carbohydrate kinase n=1 Tax=Pengzhenrongella sicca TaxID=2819238 RepID=A0A8A4ZBJ1_9MICO|nr:FGGY-family carbohydrate kinase [Pengzhenrongella sicca]QTE27956.1 carbohydrate kinase [Pengzhenrongella sicca]
MPRDVVVGLDSGGSFVKASLFDVTSGQSISRGRPVPVQHAAPGHNERDPLLMWQELAAATREAIDALPGRGDRIAAVGVTGHGNGLYLVDAAGRPTRDAVLSSDVRATSIVRGWKAAGKHERLFATTRNGLWPGQPAAILAWLQEHEAGALDGSDAALMCKDFLRVQLTGVVGTELTDQSCNGLLDNLSLDYSADVLSELGLERQRRLLKPASLPEDVVGNVTRAAAEVTGIPAGTPVIAGLVDNVALHLGSGILDGSKMCVAAGTWSVNQLLVPREALQPGGVVESIAPFAACLSIGLHRALMIEASPTSASSLSWAVDHGLTGLRAQARQAHRDVYESSLDRITSVRLRPDDPMFLPFLDGSRDEPGARAAWIGVASWNDENNLLHAIAEGVCMEHHRHLDRLAASGGSDTPVSLSGGAAQSSAWAQMFADVLGRRVEVPLGEQLGALGASVVAGLGAGLFDSLDSGLKHLMPPMRVYEPRPAASEHYAARYSRYQQAVEVLGSWT